jgi:MFS family permease
MNSPDVLNPQKTVILAVSTVAAFFAPFMGSAVNIALPSIGREFQMNAVLLGWLATAYSLAAAVCLIPFGKIADIRGRKVVFGWGSLVFALSSLMAAAAFSPAMLLVSRVLQGIGSAMIFSTGVAMLTAAYPPSERGKVLGINVSSTYIGLSLGPVLGGFLTQNFGWRSIFVILGVLGLALAGVVAFFLRGEPGHARGVKLDVLGSVVLGASLVAIMLGLSRLPRLWGAGLIAAGFAGLIGFARIEARIPNPVLSMALFKRNPVFVFSNVAALINYCATTAVGFLLSLYLQYIKGLTPQKAGLVLLAQPIVMALLSPLAGRLSDRVEPRLLASSGMAISAVGLFMVSFVGASTALVFVGAGLFVLGFGFALFSSPNTNAVMSSVERTSFGVASAVLGTMRLTGQMLSMGLATLVFSFYLGSARIVPENYPRFLAAMKTAGLFFAGLCVLGVFASHVRGKLRTAGNGERGPRA